jgi:16S rRNA (guanine527-N7)-methyltransferase
MKKNKNIKDEFNSINLNLSDKQANMINEYMDFLIKENKKYNLTSITDPKDIIKLHFLDSAALFSKKDIKGKVIDIGTGAGFPGFVFKIINSDIDLTLLEASLKKVNFLKMLQVELDLYDKIEVIHGRAEDLGQDKAYRNKYDVVTSRAVAPLNILLEYTVPFSNPDGSIILYKGPSYKDELNEAENALKTLKTKLINIYDIDIPNLEQERFILEFNVRGNLDEKYPRRAGIPKKRTL